MAAIISISSLIQTKPLIPLKPSHKLHPDHLSAFSPPSLTAGLIFAAKKGNEVLKLSKNDKNPTIVIDNYDSFTYNLCQYMGQLELSQGYHFEVYRNDELTVEELRRKKPPRSGHIPKARRTSRFWNIIAGFFGTWAYCSSVWFYMGLQCIGEAFGGKIVRSPFGVMHGKSSLVYYNEKEEADGLLAGRSNPFTAGRYHSLVIEKDSFSGDELEVRAWAEDGLTMAARHKKYKHLHGVQFHPESILTSEGKTIVRSFIKMIERKEAADSQN